MYRVNAERSQEKNDRNERMHRRTKVTGAACTLRKSSRDITTYSAWSPIALCPPLARFKRTLAAMPGGIARREPSRSFAPSIMRDDFQRRSLERTSLQSVQGAQPWPVRMML